MRLLSEVLGLCFTQADVDFVVPDLSGDRRLAIDPFLLFKSRSVEYRSAHARLLEVFNRAIGLYAQGDIAEAARILDFPEVNEIGLGYRETSAHGTGLGCFLNRLLLETLGESPALVARGVRHIEEMQLVALGINADRCSDIAANILKTFLIQYTQRQAEQYGIPLAAGVPVEHVFDLDDWVWHDGYFDLPINPLDPLRRPIILVPRRIVRALPWINFDDYQRLEFSMFLRAKRARARTIAGVERIPSKADIVAVSRREVERIDHYIDRKEHDARDADPDALVAAGSRVLADECSRLIAELGELGYGQEHAYRYQDLMFRTLNLLFEPELIEGRKQVRTEYGTEIRDLVYINDSDKTFWEFIRHQHGGFAIVFECKNTTTVENGDVDQIAGYLSDAMGYLGVVLTRQPLSLERRRKCAAWYNKGAPHRVVISLTDQDIIRMLQMKVAGNDPTELIRNHYREFMARLQ